MAAKKKTVEEKLNRLDEIVAMLEKEDTTLDESIKLYSEGVSLVSDCKGLIDGVEKQLIELKKESANETGNK